MHLSIASIKQRLHSPVTIAFGVGLVLLLFFTQGSDIKLLQIMELKALDQRFVTRGPISPHPDVVVVTIDDSSIETLGRWPWPRSTHAQLLELLSEGGAAVVGFDIIFSEEEKGFQFTLLQQLYAQYHASGLANRGDQAEAYAGMLLRALEVADNDQLFAQAIAANSRVVLPMVFQWLQEEKEAMETPTPAQAPSPTEPKTANDSAEFPAKMDNDEPPAELLAELDNNEPPAELLAELGNDEPPAELLAELDAEPPTELLAELDNDEPPAELLAELDNEEPPAELLAEMGDEPPADLLDDWGSQPLGLLLPYKAEDAAFPAVTPGASGFELKPSDDLLLPLSRFIDGAAALVTPNFFIDIDGVLRWANMVMALKGIMISAQNMAEKTGKEKGMESHVTIWNDIARILQDAVDLAEGISK